MTDHDKPEAEPDARGPTTDPMDLLVAEAVAGGALPPYEDADFADADSALTTADRQALNALGESDQLIRKVLLDLSVEKGDDTTCTASLSETQPSPERSCCQASSGSEFEALVEQVEAFKRRKQVVWTSRYHKQKELGRGAQGVVFLTRCEDELGGEQTLKVFSPKPYGDLNAYQEDMFRMVRVASRVQRIHHDNLLYVEQVHQHSGVFLMVMQRIDGYDLRRLVQPGLLQRIRETVHAGRWSYLTDVVFTMPAPRRVCLRPGVAVNIIEKCLRGLDALHSGGIVHGDVKPANIMLDCWGSIKLIDIGSAFEMDSPPKQHTWTPRYAAPEFHESGEWTPRSDLASLGYVLIELLTGQPAVTGPGVGDRSTRELDEERDAILLAEKRRLPERLPHMLPKKAQECKELMNICRRLIDPNPEKRFATATEAIEGDEGTFGFRKQLVLGDLAVYDANEVKRWIADVKNVLSA
jgi:serine/threonine-protein kinase